MKKRDCGIWVLAIMLAGGAGVAAAQPAKGEAGYPSRPVRLIAPSSPGSGVDIVARLFAQKLTQQVKQPVVVENRPGAGANLGAEIASKAPADGYTLFMATPAHAINASFYSRLNYDLARDFSPVSLVTTGQYVVIVHPSLPVTNIKSLIALGRSKPDLLSYGSGGRGNATHLAVELFATRAGVKMLHVPYKGSGPALVDLISGQVVLMFANLTAGLPHVKSGRLRALAVTDERRSPIVPDVPTVSESGLPAYVVKSYYAVFVPAGTPPAIVAKLNSDTRAVMRATDLRERLAGEGAEPAGTSPDELAAFIRKEIAMWAGVVKAARIRAD